MLICIGDKMRLDWMFFSIKPSTIISSLCYSVLRIEPYSSCLYGCIFCYAKWYRKDLEMNSSQILNAWKSLARRLEDVDLPPPVFRLSTLVEPFQDKLEMKNRIALRILEIADRYEIPLIINTKSDLIMRSPWIDVILKLSDKNLVLVQVSIVTTNSNISKALEPGAPIPQRRLALIERLRDHSVPVVVRLQPLIPGIENLQLETAKEVLNYGALGIIVEPLRETRNGLAKIAKAIGIAPKSYLNNPLWKPYSFSSNNQGLLYPDIEWRKRMFYELFTLTLKFGKALTICKDGLWLSFSIYNADCCQSWHIKRTHAMRETLYECLVSSKSRFPHIYLLSYGDFQKYPRVIRRALRLHYNKLIKVLNNKKLLRKLIITNGSHAK